MRTFSNKKNLKAIKAMITIRIPNKQSVELNMLMNTHKVSYIKEILAEMNKTTIKGVRLLAHKIDNKTGKIIVVDLEDCETINQTSFIAVIKPSF